MRVWLVAFAVCIQLAGFGQSRFLQEFAPKHGLLIPIKTAFQTPYGDMADRFGKNNTIGIGFEYKTQSNWMFGVEYNWMFSNNVIENSMFDSLVGETGILINNTGGPTLYRFEQRGHQLFGQVSRVIPFTKNKNSGFLITGGVGYLRHKIKFIYPTDQAPQIQEYEHGYDRLTAGLAFKGFVGYQFLDPMLRVNVRFGYEFIHANTQSLRPYQFDTRMYDDQRRVDQLGAFKLELCVPFYFKKAEDEFFFE
jgi:hypothetical protein